MANYKTFNPVINECDYKNELFIKIPVPSVGEVTLLSGENGLLEINPENYNRISTRQIRVGKYNRQIRMDATAHEISFSFNGISANNVNTFNFIVSAMCKIENAAIIYKTKSRDICALIRPSLENKIKNIALEYQPNDISALRGVLNDPFHNNIASYDGIEILSINIEVDVDEEYKRHLKDSLNIDKNSELRKKEIELSQDLAQRGIDETTAIYADVVTGKISLSDAANMLKQINNASFDENFRRLNIVKDTLFDLVQKGILTEEQAAQQVAVSIASLSPSSEQNQSSLLLNENTSEKSKDNPYQAIDD